MKKLILALALLFCAAPRCLAWGADGHRMVAEVAMHYLSPGTKEAVMKVLRKTTPEEASTWMDEMRSNNFYGYMRHWHYVDIAKDSQYVAGQGDNLIAALNTAYNEIKAGKVSKDKRKEDLMIIFHLIGDMAQPLHTGYPEDKGGNDVEVSYEGGGTNLHHVWDDDIIASEHITIDSCLQYAATLSQDDKKHFISGNFVAWMYDSRSHLPEAYDFPGHKIDEAYAKKNKVLVERQIVAGGLRLARVLETLFGTPAAQG